VLNISPSVKFKPSVLAKYQTATGLQYDLNAHFLLADRLWLGASYRTEDAMVFMAEFQLTQVFRIGYAYDLTTSQLSGYQNGSHEFMLGLDLDVKRSKMISPRYF
jgi:type IX secretion system PorP/SprF family membrane protein